MKLLLMLAATAALAACATDRQDNREMKSVDSMAMESRVTDTVSLDMTGMT